MNARVMTDEELAQLSDDEIAAMVEAPEMAPQPDAGADANTGEEDGTRAEGDQETSGDGGASDEDAAGGDDPDAPAGDAEGGGEPDGEKPAPSPAKAEDGAENPLGGDDDQIDKAVDKGKDAAATKPGEKVDDKLKAAAKDPNKDAAKETKAGDKETKEGGDTAAPVDYKAAYEKIMAPFKAAGKMVQLNSPDEVIQLMQMGAHYTKKMQALQPNLKLLRMLENNQLLDEGKLSFLIDVSRKDPGAIQKLLRESGLDPLEIDTSVEPNYRPGNHKVPDEEIAFTTTLEEVASDPAGKDLIVTINKTWDAGSKEALWGEPNLLRVLTEQKNNGIYDQIASEIERRKTLGYIQNEPFLQSYETVGKELQAKGVLTPKSATQEQAAVAPNGQPDGHPAQHRRIVETRPAQPKTVQNNDKARAASPSKAAPAKKSTGDFNPLALSDEDFEKNAALAMKL